MHTVAIIDAFHPGSLDTIKRCLPADWQLQIAASTSASDAAKVMSNADVLFVMGSGVSADLIEQAPKLKFIQKLGAGVDNIDAKACQARGIVLAKLQGGNAVPVAEHTLLMTLATLRRLPQLDRETRDGQWVRERARTVSRQLSNKTVGIVGFGAIGKAYAQILLGFQVRVLYHDVVTAPVDVCQRLNATAVNLETLLSESDIVSLHVPLTDLTRHMIGAKELARMKHESVLINCARGGVVDEAALYNSLASGAIHGAGIDVFQEEPTHADNPLFKLSNCVVTPHTAGGTVDNFENVVRKAIDNVYRLDRGEEIPSGDRIV